MKGMSFDSGSAVTKVSLGGVEVSVSSIDEPAGTELGLSIDRYLVFDQADQLVVAVGA